MCASNEVSIAAFLFRVASDLPWVTPCSKGHFDKLMEEDTTAGSAHLPRLARQLATKTNLTSAKVCVRCSKKLHCCSPQAVMSMGSWV